MLTVWPRFATKFFIVNFTLFSSTKNVTVRFAKYLRMSNQWFWERRPFSYKYFSGWPELERGKIITNFLVHHFEPTLSFDYSSSRYSWFFLALEDSCVESLWYRTRELFKDRNQCLIWKNLICASSALSKVHYSSTSRNSPFWHH